MKPLERVVIQKRVVEAEAAIEMAAGGVEIIKIVVNGEAKIVMLRKTTRNQNNPS